MLLFVFNVLLSLVAIYVGLVGVLWLFIIVSGAFVELQEAPIIGPILNYLLFALVGAVCLFGPLALFHLLK